MTSALIRHPVRRSLLTRLRKSKHETLFVMRNDVIDMNPSDDIPGRRQYTVKRPADLQRQQ